MTQDGEKPGEEPSSAAALLKPDAGAPEPASPAPRPSRARSRATGVRQIRRAPPPNLTGFFDSPQRNLIGGLGYILFVASVAVFAYTTQGWSLRDAVYMVVETLYTVGYGEVHPIDSTPLYVITLTLIILGSSGMIFLTGVVVQFFTINQINKIAGRKKMEQQIDQIEGHVIVCGFGRVGMVLSRALRRSSATFVVIEESEARIAEARAAGFLCLCGDPGSEDMLIAAGVRRAHALASCLGNDALNIVVTLSARALNPDLFIAARGDKPSTESKLILAGADRVVLPEFIGGERIAELFLHQEAAQMMDNLEKSDGFQRGLRTFGMELQAHDVAPRSAASRMTVGALERQAKGAFFIVQINRGGRDVQLNPQQNESLREGDTVLTLGRPDREAAVANLFESRQMGGARNL